jgi:hypothetical protein
MTLQFSHGVEALPVLDRPDATCRPRTSQPRQAGWQLVGSKMDERLKVLILGLMVMNAVGKKRSSGLP